VVNVVLLEPRTSGNVGTIGRTIVALGGILHLIKPYGWGSDITDKEVKKAGLDYWNDLKWYQYENIEEFWQKNPLSSRHFFATTKTEKPYFEATFSPYDYLYFGREDAGLPQELLENNKEKCINIPMTKGTRSINIANSVSTIAYDVVRQNYEAFLKL
jgi:tRNA (cytidine/uridine-2'-O-)-methyltransferase